MNSWRSVADAYAASFATLCAGTVDSLLDALSPAPAAPRPLAHLDVGCGDGTLAAESAARGNRVVALDADPAMGRRAAARLASPVLLAALPQLPFDDGRFDVVTANFVVNHVADPRASTQEMVRVLRPTGLMGMTVWPAGGASWSALISDMFREAGAVAPPASRLPAELDFERTPSGTAQMVEDSGGIVLEARETSWTWRTQPEALWAGIRGGVATPGATYLAQDHGVRRRIEAIYTERTRAMCSHGRLEFPCRASLVVARPR